jgi:hypothetical protein
MSWYWLIPIVLIAGCALFLAASRPGFWIAIAKSLVMAMLPSIAKAVKPKDLTDEEKAQIREGKDPISERFNPRHSGGGGKNG